MRGSRRPQGRSVRRWAPVAVYMGVIFALSSISRPPDLPSALGDKGGHALLYSGLATPNMTTEPDKKEFIRISQAVGIGFLIMGQ